MGSPVRRRCSGRGRTRQTVPWGCYCCRCPQPLPEQPCRAECLPLHSTIKECKRLHSQSSLCVRKPATMDTFHGRINRRHDGHAELPTFETGSLTVSAVFRPAAGKCLNMTDACSSPCGHYARKNMKCRSKKQTVNRKSTFVHWCVQHWQVHTFIPTNSASHCGASKLPTSGQVQHSQGDVGSAERGAGLTQQRVVGRQRRLHRHDCRRHRGIRRERHRQEVRRRWRFRLLPLLPTLSPITALVDGSCILSRGFCLRPLVKLSASRSFKTEWCMAASWLRLGAVWYLTWVCIGGGPAVGWAKCVRSRQWPPGGIRCGNY